jgi:hypothetical protein
MTVARRNRPPGAFEGATPIDSGAIENLRYIRSTIEAAHAFTTVPGRGCVAMGLIALGAAGLVDTPTLASHWLSIWLGAAAVAALTALAFLGRKAAAQGLSLARGVAKRFFLALLPSFVAGAVLTAALYEPAAYRPVAGVWLLCYGAGLAASGVHSIRAVMVAGFAFMLLGGGVLFLPVLSPTLLLAIGFGGVHIGLGLVIARYHGG